MPKYAFEFVMEYFCKNKNGYNEKVETKKKDKNHNEIMSLYINAFSWHETLNQWNFTIIVGNMHHYKRDNAHDNRSQ